MRRRWWIGVLVCLATGIARCEDWPQFRGPTGQGHSATKGLPLTWSDTENVAWKVPVPGRGWSSPAVVGRQLWLTTALDEGRSLRARCLDARSGKTLHDVEVFQLDGPGSIHDKNSYASPTPLVENGRVYIHFGALGTACLTTDGQVAWRTQELKYNHRHGPAGSPVVWRDLLLVSCDGTDVQYVAALDAATGKLRWKSPRRHTSQARLTGQAEPPMAYTTPLLVEVAGRTQLISSGSDQVVAYDPASGEEIWWATYNGYSTVPRPVFDGERVFVAFGFGPGGLFAVRGDGLGDVTASHVAWEIRRGAPQSPSPLIVGSELYLLTDQGILTCLDAASGEQHYQKRIGGDFSASPIWADGRIYLLDENGRAIVIRPGQRFEQLAVNKVVGRTLASLAVADGAIFLRTDAHLYRLQTGVKSGE